MTTGKQQKSKPRKAPKQYNGKPKASRKLNGLAVSFKEKMSMAANSYDSWMKSLHHPKEFISPLGFGTWRNSTVSQIVSTDILTTNSDGLAYFKYLPMYSSSTAGLSTPGFLADSTRGTWSTVNCTGVSDMAQFTGSYLRADYRLSSFQVEVRSLTTTLNEGGRAVVLHNSNDLSEADARVNFGYLASHSRSKEFSLKTTDPEGIIYRAYLLPVSKTKCQEWHSPESDQRTAANLGWGPLIGMLESSVAGSRYEIKCWANYELSPIAIDGGTNLDMRDVPNGRFQPECPTLSKVDLLRGKSVSAYTPAQHNKMSSIVSTVSDTILRAGAWLTRHQELLHGLAALGTSATIPFT